MIQCHTAMNHCRNAMVIAWQTVVIAWLQWPFAELQWSEVSLQWSKFSCGCVIAGETWVIAGFTQFISIELWVIASEQCPVAGKQRSWVSLQWSLQESNAHGKSAMICCRTTMIRCRPTILHCKLHVDKSKLNIRHCNCAMVCSRQTKRSIQLYIGQSQASNDLKTTINGSILLPFSCITPVLINYSPAMPFGQPKQALS